MTMRPRHFICFRAACVVRKTPRIFEIDHLNSRLDENWRE
jgi:hypothetical protein